MQEREGSAKTVSPSAAPQEAGKIECFLADICEALPADAIITDALRTFAYGTDASLYRLTPKAVLRPRNEGEVAAILRAASEHGVPVTFRAAGTSLSGQAITESVLVQIGDGWRGWKIGEGGERITLGPAVVGGHANILLKSHGRRLGPDPASIDTAQIGGIAANNASGMCCGVAQNTYHTVESMRVMLWDGAILDTGDPHSRAAFARSHPDLLDGLAALAREIHADEALAKRIARKFAIKNTCGYSLNALIDFDEPIDMLQHLMVGSEGTLGFISSITYRTVPDPSHKATALVAFADVRAACEAVMALKSQPVDAVELMDRASLRSVEHQEGMPLELRRLPAEAAALLIETRASSADALDDQVARVRAALADARRLGALEFTRDAQESARLWAVRKGTFTSVGAMRAPGTAVIIEDVAVETEKLADATEDLRALFARHGYDDAIIFGHALAGNLHFVLTPDFAQPGALERYAAFMDDLSRLIVERHDGSLKAEHGTGRNMAPFVELEWGAQATDLMWRLKRLFDPRAILNPGVILNNDPHIHTRNIKPMPRACALIDKCIECGYCEPTCPSRALTLTPRQRITVYREIARLGKTGEDPARLRELERAYQYQAIDTCAVDSLCAKACPVAIDTGRFVKGLRARRWGRIAPRVAAAIGKNFRAVAFIIRYGLGAADLMHRVLGTRAMSGLTGGARWLSRGLIPLWTPSMPGMGRTAPIPRAADHARPRVVYFPSCASRAMGPARGDAERDPLSAKVISLFEKAGFQPVYPEAMGGMCCGQPFDSKGLNEEAGRKSTELERALLEASRGGKDPIVFDTSPCAFRIMKRRNPRLNIHDLPDFLHDEVLPKLTIVRREGTVAVHPTCSTLKLGTQTKLIAIAQACAEEVVCPPEIHCCGWSGDRGFTLPELNASALRTLSMSLPKSCAEGFSSSRTCEIGLSQHSGRPYRSIAYLLDRCSEARSD